jgi:hypothetical protein
MRREYMALRRDQRIVAEQKKARRAAEPVKDGSASARRSFDKI